jgi:uncharacterized membrane protein
MTMHRLLERLEEEHRIDPVANRLHEPVRRFLEGKPALRDFLTGRWLDHPLHSALTDVPVGAFALTTAFDALSVAGGPPWLPHAAQASAAVGLVGGVVAAAPGLADWSKTRATSRRVGLLHALNNTTAMLFYALSCGARRSGHRGVAAGCSGLGLGVLMFGAWLGGELSYRHGVGVHAEARSSSDTGKGRGEIAPA